MAEEVAVGVDLDVEPGLAHPAGGERVRLVLLSAPRHTVRARPAADRVQLLEPLKNLHRCHRAYYNYYKGDPRRIRLSLMRAVSAISATSGTRHPSLTEAWSADARASSTTSSCAGTLRRATLALNPHSS